MTIHSKHGTEQAERVAIENKKAADERRAKLAARPPRPKPLLPRNKKEANQVIQGIMQKFLRAQDPTRKDDVTRMQSVLEAQYKLATDTRSGQCKQAAELLLAYGFDKPKPAKDELDAMAKSGFQVVYVKQGGLENVPTEHQPPTPEPKFIEGEFEENEK